jgi:hypothetical protein
MCTGAPLELATELFRQSRPPNRQPKGADLRLMPCHHPAVRTQPLPGHYLLTLGAQMLALVSEATMPVVKRRASTILGELDQAQTELVGKAVILTEGKAGTVEQVWLDEHHGLRISIRGHYGKWPVSTIEFAQG